MTVQRNKLIYAEYLETAWYMVLEPVRATMMVVNLTHIYNDELKAVEELSRAKLVSNGWKAAPVKASDRFLCTESLHTLTYLHRQPHVCKFLV